jgi:hypothetical protein
MSFLITKSFVHSSIFTLIYSITNFGSVHKEHYLGVGDIPRIPSWLYMGRTIRGGLAHKIKACNTRLQGVLDLIIVPNQILYL